MIINTLKHALELQQGSNKLFTRTILKEVLQDYILNFVYNNNEYKNLIFTGGTALRKIYGLPRLSEDLDFDFTKKLYLEDFLKQLKDHFVQKLQFSKLETKLANNKQTVFIKFPTILRELGLVKDNSNSTVLFVRCDFSHDKWDYCKTEVHSVTTSDFTFFVLSYDLSTLFANKIAAFLQREFFKGKDQSVAFKGRDLFDLIWFMEQSKKSGFSLKPNWKRLLTILGFRQKKDVIKRLVDKVKLIRETDVRRDLEPFISSSETVTAISHNFVNIIQDFEDLL